MPEKYVGAAIKAPWFCLRLPSCGRRFKSQAHNIIFFRHLQNFEIDRSTVWYRKKIIYQDWGISESWQKTFFVSSLLQNFKFFVIFCQNFQKTNIFEVQKLLSLGIISVPFQIFRARNEKVRWMVEILQELTFFPFVLLKKVQK